MSGLPVALPGEYESIVYLILVFADGVLFGVAIKKAFLSAVLAIAGLTLASLIGLSLPGISVQLLISKALTYIAEYITKAPSFFVGLPLVFILGLAVGIWRG